MNHVRVLIERKISEDEKLELKRLGPHRPLLRIDQHCRNGEKHNDFTRHFHAKWYKKKPWMCGCEATNALFCYVCLLFQNDDSKTKEITQCEWTTTGVSKMNHLPSKCASHESRSSHIRNATSYALLGKKSIISNTSVSCRSSANLHKEKVDKNRYVLSKVIDCIKLCTELDLEQGENSLNCGLFVGLIELVANLDSTLKSHLQDETFLKGLLQPTVQNQLLDCMLEVYRGEILLEISAAEFVSIQVCEMTDLSKRPQLLMILRYESSGNLVERFWGIFNPSATTVDSFSKAILEQLDKITHASSDKLISQSYDGAFLLQGPEGSVPTIINKQYQRAHLVHSYTHQLNMIAQQATYSIPALRIFFSSLSSFTAFFADAPERIAVLNTTLAQRHQAAPPFGWDFDSRVVNTVFAYVTELMAALQNIKKGSNFNAETTREATILLDLLKKPSFRFWLHQFNSILMNFDFLSTLLQTQSAEIRQTEDEVLRLQTALAMKLEIDPLAEYETEDDEENEDEAEDGVGPGDGYLEEPTAPKVRRIEQTRINLMGYAKRACELISADVTQRFSYNGHLAADNLLTVDLFSKFTYLFPHEIFKITCASYPCLNRSKLKSELLILYDTKELRVAENKMDLLRFFLGNNLTATYSEVIRLLRIVVTTPMVTSESGRCFTTVQRVKTFLRQTKCSQRLNALAMLTVEKKFIHEISLFNTKVIDKFAQIDVHRKDFMYS